MSKKAQKIGTSDHVRKREVVVTATTEFACRGAAREVITGWTTEITMSDAAVLDWTREMCILGFKYDCDNERTLPPNSPL
jgi:hypothetical protein